MPINADEIKAILTELSTSELTCSARLVAVIHALGIEEPKEIEALTGLKSAGARKARNQLKEYRHSSSATPVARYHSSATTVANRHSSSADPPRATCAGITTHATKESPSEILNASKQQAASSARDEIEIEGLNGQTAMCVDWLAKSLNPWAPDRETARQILSSNVAIYGAPKVLAGISELQTHIAAGEKPRNFAKAFPAFVKNASTEPAPKPISRSDAMAAALAKRAAAREAREVH